jgi:hypothetical protein
MIFMFQFDHFSIDFGKEYIIWFPLPSMSECTSTKCKPSVQHIDEDDDEDGLNVDIIEQIEAHDVAKVRLLCHQQKISGRNHIKGEKNYLHAAIEEGDDALPIVVLLMCKFKYRADMEWASQGVALNVAVACKKKAPKIIEWLLTFSSCDVDLPISSYSSLTPLGIAAIANDMATIHQLLAA